MKALTTLAALLARPAPVLRYYLRASPHHLMPGTLTPVLLTDADAARLGRSVTGPYESLGAAQRAYFSLKAYADLGLT